MRVVVFAHTPPPLHGQSRMVQLLVESLKHRSGTACGNMPPEPVECYHVNARLSKDLQDVGSARWRKLFLLAGYCLQALWLRVRHGATVFYFLPAAPIRASLYRDWFVMLLCRPFYRHTVFHWHAVGLGQWLENQGGWWERRITHALMGGADLAIVLSELNQTDAQKFRPRRLAVIPNGIPDPCPDYTKTTRARRAVRREQRRALLSDKPPDGVSDGAVRVLFMAHCTRDKGLFDAIEGLRLANQQLAARRSPAHLQLSIAGAFRSQSERAELQRTLSEPTAQGWLIYKGFLDDKAKAAALEEADLFCFPTYYASEGQPLNLIEAMAYGLPIVSTRWRSIPELLPPNYPGLVEVNRPEQVAAACLRMLTESGEELRRRFLEMFLLEKHVAAVAKEICALASGP